MKVRISCLYVSTFALSYVQFHNFLSSEVIKVYDGDLSLKRKIFRTITVSRLASAEHILNTTLEAFHIQKNSGKFDFNACILYLYQVRNLS